jgi:hypothetical protein
MWDSNPHPDFESGTSTSWITSANTRGRIRTDPGSILSALSLPLDYTGKVVLERIELSSYTYKV